MRVIFNISDEPEQKPLGKRITFGKLEFIFDQFGDLCLQDLSQLKKENSPSRYVLSLSG